MTEDDVIAYLEGRVSGYKLPRKVFFFEEMPKTSYGKITKKLIRQTLVDRNLIQIVEPA
jgi:acyl-CoA synthetase (AMP-forming)/AMP-acid ligase II